MYGGPMSGQQACFKCQGTGKAYGLTQCRA